MIQRLLFFYIIVYLQTLKKENMEFELREGEDFITLIQLLKAVGVSYNGAEAQRMVVDGLVSLNGELESRKRAKIRRGDVVKVFDTEIKIK
jgi:ribosome-associated protein